MIQELKNFVEHISKNDKDIFARNLILKEGIYILLEIEKQGEDYVLLNENEIFDTKEDILVYDGKSEVENKEYLLSILTNIKPTSAAKIFNPNKKIYNASCSGFALAFNKKNYADKNENVLISELLQYFQSAEKYIEKENNTYQIWFHGFKGFCLNRLVSFMQSLDEYKEAKLNTNIYLFLKQPHIDDYIKVHQAYLSEKVFNKDKFNIKVENKTFGISDSLSGFNDKKMFLKHHTLPLEYNYRVDGEVAMQLWRFFQLQQNKQIPNPVPVFVDEEELNLKMISIFNADKDYKMGHGEMIKSILSQSDKKELQNYYLIYFQGTKGSRVADIDFIPNFKYEEKDAQIVEVFNLGGSQTKHKIENVFDLESHVFNRIFNGQLKSKAWLKYFGEIKYDPKYLTDTTYNQLLKYRQSIYDFIYKSKRQAITAKMFDDMMINGILDDLRHDELKNN